MPDQEKPSISSFITICTATAFALTVTHIYAISIPLTSNLFQYFTLDDYFRHAIQWLAPIVISMGIGYFIGWTMSFIKSRGKIGTTSTIGDTRINKQSKTILIIACGLIALMPVLSYIIYYFGYLKVVLSQIYAIFLTSSMFIVLLIFVFIVQFKNPLRSIIFFFITIFMLNAWFVGLKMGEQMGERTNQPPKTRIMLLESKTPLQGQMVFLLDKYAVFLKQNERTVIAIPTSRIGLIEEIPDAKTAIKP